MEDQVVYQTTSGATTRFSQGQYQSLLDRFGSNNVDKLLADMGMFRAGSGTSSALHDYASSLNIPYNDRTADYIIESFLNEKASENAWNRSVFSQKNQYQWLVEDLQKAGLNPWLALSGLNGAVASSSGNGVSGGLMTSKRNNDKTNQTNLVKTLLTAILSVVGIALFKG